MSEEVKYHIGAQGPRRCHANKRACRYAEDPHGGKEEMQQVWEAKQEAQFADSMLAGVSKESSTVDSLPAADKKLSSSKADSEVGAKGNEGKEPQKDLKELDPKALSRLKAERALSARDKYEPLSKRVVYSDAEKDIAMKLALSNLTELSYTPVKSRDDEWSTNGMSSVQRYELEDGSVGYFKSFATNSANGEYFFEGYGTTSLEASINEVNAHRMAKLFGDEYAEMVPETVLREIDGKIGTLQREVETDRELSSSYDEVPQLKGDYRKAALFDFVIGNADRHSSNFLYGAIDTSGGERQSRIRLIDNSFSFPRKSAKSNLNQSCFATNSSPTGYFQEEGYTIPKEELTLTNEERATVSRVKSGVEEWVKNGTISDDQALALYDRADYLLKDESKLGEYRKYIEELSGNSGYDLSDDSW